jgi:hypothetical protein
MDHSDMRTDSPAADMARDQVSQSNVTGSGDSTQVTHGMADRARDIAGVTREKLVDVGNTVRDRAGTLKDSLADALESGADKLRSRGAAVTPGSPTLAGETGTTNIATADGRAVDVSQKVATGMQATADWLRETDLDGLKTSVERQVKEHPGRTLLIAVGLGYLLGKALRK